MKSDLFQVFGCLKNIERKHISEQILNTHNNGRYEKKKFCPKVVYKLYLQNYPKIAVKALTEK